MRILIYVEPYPIRDTLTHFSDIAKEFLPLLAAGPTFDVRIFANDATFASLDEQCLAPHLKKLIRTTRRENEIFNEYLKLPWIAEGLPVWLDLMAGKGEVTGHQLDLLRRIWNMFPFEMIVHWGENGAVTRFVEERPVTRVAMELGCTRPPFFNSVVMDPFGANGAAVVPKLTLGDLRGIVDDQPLSRHEALFGFSKDIEARGYSLQFEALWGELDVRWANRKAAFLPLQLFDDANLTRFSPYETLTDVVLDVVPRLAEAGYLTIVKPHPASKFRNGSLYANSFAHRALRPWSDSVVWCDETTPVSNSRLFTIADLVVTVNSSVGFEALYYDKPVVVLGDAVYKPKDMFPTLDEALSGGFDRRSYLDAAGILRRFMLGGYLQPESLRQDASGFCTRLGLIHHLCQRNAGDPVRFAADFWRACAPAQTALARSAMFWGVSIAGNNELGAASNHAVRARPPVAQADDPAGNGQRFLPIVRRLKRYWLALRTCEWLEDRWATDAGRLEVVIAGAMVDPDYYLATYPDVKAAGADPVEHYAWSGLSEERSPRAGIRPAAAAEILAHLKRCAELPTGRDDVPSSAPFDDPKSVSYPAIFARLVEHVSALGIEGFPEWLDRTWSGQTSRARLIEVGEFVDARYYLDKYPDVKDAKVDPAHHFAWNGLAERRSPRAGIGPATSDELLSLLKAAAELPEDAPGPPVHPLPAAIERRREDQILGLRGRLATRGNRIAVVAHLYYTDLVPQILDRLQAVEEPFDLIVTMPDWGTRRTVELVREVYPEAVFYAASNRGRDIGPFIDLLPTLIERNYDAVLKLQTKRGYFRSEQMIPEFGEIWRDEAIDALLGSAARVAAIIDGFRRNERLNMVGPQPFLLPLDKYPYHDGGVLAEAMIEASGSEIASFFAGTMFWVRPACLRPLAGLTLSHFAPESGTNDGALAHLVERMFGQAARAGRGEIAAAPVNPGQALDFEPEPLGITLDAYFSQRESDVRSHKAGRSWGNVPASGED